MRDFMDIAKALSDENRVRLLLMLCKGELCACQIIEVLGIAPSTASKHLSVLHKARLVNSRKDSRWVYYRLSEDAPDNVSAAIRWVKDSLDGCKREREDARLLKKILKVSPEELCINKRESA